MANSMADYIRTTADAFLAHAPNDKALQDHCAKAKEIADDVDYRHSVGDRVGANEAWWKAHPFLTAAGARAKALITPVLGFTPAVILNQEMGESYDEHQKYVDNINEGLKNGR
jgi:hypothetical protein